MTRALPPRIEPVDAAGPAPSAPPARSVDPPAYAPADAPATPPAEPRLRIEVVDGAAGRLEFDPVQVEAVAGSAAIRRAHLLLGGALVLLLGLPTAAGVGLVMDQFARASPLGWLTLAICIVGGALVLAGLLREWASLRALDAVDRLRHAMAGPDTGAKMLAARRWAAQVRADAPLQQALRTVNDPDAAIALLRAGPGTTLRGKAERLGWVAGAQVAAGIAAVPSPVLDVVLAAWAGLRLLRQVGQLYGVRPGGLALLGLMRRTAIAATTVGIGEIAANTAATALISNAVVSRLAGEVAGAGLAARRMVVMARAAAAACDPLPPR